MPIIQQNISRSFYDLSLLPLDHENQNRAQGPKSEWKVKLTIVVWSSYIPWTWNKFSRSIFWYHSTQNFPAINILNAPSRRLWAKKVMALWILSSISWKYVENSAFYLTSSPPNQWFDVNSYIIGMYMKGIRKLQSK